MKVTRELLHRLYWEDGLSQREIAELLGMKRDDIKYLMKKLGVQTRDRAEAIRLAYKKKGEEIQKKRIQKLKKFALTKEQLHDLYWGKGLSIDEIAFLTGYTPHMISKWLRKYDIPRRPPHKRRGTNVAHNMIARKLLPELGKKFKKVIALSINASIDYAPDFIVIDNNGRILAYEVETRTGKKIKEKIRKAREAGFDGIILYLLQRKLNRREEKIIFGEQRSLDTKFTRC